MTVPILNLVKHWYCPNCGAESTTTETRPHSRLHTCPKLLMMSVPMVPKGTAAKVELKEREDYVGKEQVQLFEGRPVMAIVTTRDNGQDARVFAPVASASAKEM